MSRIDFDVTAKAVRRSVGGVRPGPQRIFVTAEVEVINRTPLRIRLRAVPAVFVAADSTRYEPVHPGGWAPEVVSLAPQEAGTVPVVFEVPRTLAGSGTIEIVRPDGSAGDRLHLAS